MFTLTKQTQDVDMVGQAGVDRIQVGRGELTKIAVSEIMDYFRDPRASGTSLAEFESLHIASRIVQRALDSTVL
jgi:hypothetical protein